VPLQPRLALLGPLLAIGVSQAADLDAPPLTLDAVVTATLEHNIEGRILRNAVSEAALDTQEAKAAFDTRLYSTLNSFDRSGAEIGTTFEAGVTKLLESGSRVGLGFVNSQYGSSKLSELKLSYTLPFFGNHDRKELLAVETTALEERARARQLRAGLEGLALRAVTAYYEVVLAKDAEAVADRSADNARLLYRVAEIRAPSSEVGPMALRAAALKVRQVQFVLQSAHHRRDTAETQLRMLAGFPPDLPLPIVETIPQLGAEAPTESLDALTNRALSNRADLVNMRADLAPLEHRAKIERERVLVPIDITLQMSMTGEGDRFDDSVDLDKPQFGVGMAMALGDRKQRSNVRRRLELELQNRRYALTHLEQTVRTEVQKAYYETHESRVEALLAAQQAELEAEALARDELRFRAGLADVQSVLDEQQSVVDARFRSLESRARYVVACYRLDTTVGRMPDEWTRTAE